MEAKTALASAENQLKSTDQMLLKFQSDLEHAQQQNVFLGRELAASRATNAAFENQLSQAKSEHTLMQQRLEDARRDFTAELEKQRQATTLAKERCRAMETRSLLDIDRERSTLLKLQKELEATKQNTALLTERHAKEISALQHQLGDARQKAGILEGKLQASNSTHESVLQEVKSLQAQSTDLSNQLLILRNETANPQRQIGTEQVSSKAVDLKKTRKTARKSP